MSPLINIVTGVEAGDHVTCHEAIVVGNCIMNNMIGKGIYMYKYMYKYKFKRNMAIKIMNSVTISIDGYSFSIDPNLMFQRLLAAVILKKDAINLEHVFMHELCTYPPRLFQSEKFLLPADNNPS